MTEVSEGQLRIFTDDRTNLIRTPVFSSGHAKASRTYLSAGTVITPNDWAHSGAEFFYIPTESTRNHPGNMTIHFDFNKIAGGVIDTTKESIWVGEAYFRGDDNTIWFPLTMVDADPYNILTPNNGDAGFHKPIEVICHAPFLALRFTSSNAPDQYRFISDLKCLIT